ncbi:MAG: uracil-DNA glycosylase [Candidatus Celaenobacter polaris]|nr:uracil-DNA glycosylase [Candidatus Celaenobacter polaris]
MKAISEAQLRKIELLKLSGINEIFVQETEPVSKEEYLRQFEAEYKDCKKCKLAQTRNKLVWGGGSADADIVFVGEGPGEQEDLQGEPFVGKAGQLLTKMLAAIDLSREDVYITNIVKCRPPGNRNPKEDEIQACMPYLEFQLSIIQPKIICALGKVAGNTLLKNDDTLTRMRQKFFPFSSSKLMVTYHPSALLHNPDWKRPSWQDLKMLKREYAELR